MTSTTRTDDADDPDDSDDVVERDVGPLGERDVDRWAAQVGLTAISSAARDVDGWDFVLSWPLRTGRRAAAPPSGSDGVQLSAPPLDRQPGPIQCFVQVKASDRRRRSWPVKVTTWLQLVQKAVPAFFLVLEYDGKPECQRAYLAHVGGPQIRAALKRVRELEARGQRHQLHRHYHPLTWSKADALDAVGGAGLRARIEALVGPNLDAYVAAKARLRQSVGYEDGGTRLTGRVRVPEEWKGDPRDLLLDFMLGLVRDLEVTDVEVRDTRFGIDAPEPELRAASARLGSDGVAPFGPGRLRFAIGPTVAASAPDPASTPMFVPSPEGVGEARDGGDPAGGVEVGVAEAAGRLAPPPLTPSAAPQAPPTPLAVPTEVDLTGDARVVWDPAVEGRGKVRLSAPCLDLVLSLPEGRTKLNMRLPRAQEERALGELRAMADLIALAAHAHDLGAEVTAALRVNGAPLGAPSTVVGFGARATPLRGWAALVRLAARVARDLELPPTVPVTAHGLADQEDALWFLDAIFRPAALAVRWQATVSSVGERPDGLWCMPIAVSARIGAYTAQVGAGLVGHATRMTPMPGGETRLLVEQPEVRFHARRVYPPSEHPETTDRELHDEIVHRYTREEMTVVSGVPYPDGVAPNFEWEV